MKRFVVSTVVVATALGLVGCSAVSPTAFSEAEAPSMGIPAPMAPEAIRDSGFDGGVAGADSDMSSSPGQQMITRGSLSVTVTDPIESADDVSRIARTAGGYVESRNEYVGTPNSPGRAELVLRIPSSRLGGVLDDLKALGEARDTTISSEDVTQLSQDLAARITALETSVDRLLALLERADDTDTLITIERELSTRQAELEGLKAQKRYLDDQVSMSTISVYLIAERDAPVEDPDTFWTGLQAGWDAFVGFWAGVLVVLGVLAPWLVLLGLIALVIVFIVRRATRKPELPGGTQVPQSSQPPSS
ncbi:MAG TPA: DUF4349 domain-containing protein [Terrimesophilobacter sp.]|nr:DUF4349 domain-containing protein [Terrimesophilobacter sp.]